MTFNDIKFEHHRPYMREVITQTDQRVRVYVAHQIRADIVEQAWVMVWYEICQKVKIYEL